MRPLTCLALLLLTVAAGAAPTVEAVALKEPVVLDGELREAVWQAPAQVRDFVVLGTGVTAQAQTEAWVAHDADALYIAVRAAEPDMAGLRAACSVRDGRDLFQDDVVEVFLDPARDRFHYLQFACNPLGTRFDLQGDAAGSSPEWNGLWEVATQRAADCWLVEMRLPFATLGLDRGAGQVWGLNICRERPAGPENSSWAPATGAFGTPASFGDLQIAADLSPFRLDLAVQDWGQKFFGQNTLVAEITNRTPTGQMFDVQLRVTPPSEHPRTTSRDSVTLAAGESAPVSVAYQLLQAGPHELLCTVVGPEKRVLAAEGRMVDVSALAEFMIHKSFYRDDLVLQYQISVPDNDLARYGLRLAVRPTWTEETVVTRELMPIAARVGHVPVDTTGLERGRYVLRAGLVGAEGEPLVSTDLRFAVLRDPAVNSRLVDVRAEDNMLIVQGQPFFPLGIYESPGTEAYLRMLRDAGFNLCMCHGLPDAGAQALLDKVYAAGMRLWVPLGSLLDFSSDAAMKRQRLAEMVQRAGDHPGLLIWESIDEPAWGGADADGLYEGYCHLRLIDQQRLIWTNHAPRNLISTLAYYNRATDASGCDIYPVPDGAGHSNLPNSTISVVGDETRKNREAVGGQKPVFMVLQGFGWGELSRGQTPRPAVITPTFEQSRFMAYDAIVHGANGLLYWGTHYTEKPSRFWSELRSLVSELAALHDVLAALPYRGEDQAQLASPAKGVVLLHKQHNRRNFLFLVNETAVDTTATVKAPNIYAGHVRRLFEGAELPMGPEQVLTVPLGPYGVAVLTDDADFVDVRRDFTADWRDAPDGAAIRSLMIEEGNAVRNPGFEVDRDGDNLPDRWGSNTPLTASLTNAEVHGGRVALALTSTGPDMGPLLVERGLELLPDRKYRFTAWVKSPSPETEFRFYVEWSLGGRWLGGTYPWSKGSGEWQQLSLEFTTTPDPQGGAYAVVQMRGKGTVYFDDLRIEEVAAP
ncbi:MAG: hypothetical protein HPY69_05695 [Armatimonadetes bacterium]|nr:hypothetical protein [Armatimonadota bacterium]